MIFNSKQSSILSLKFSLFLLIYKKLLSTVKNFKKKILLKCEFYKFDILKKI